MLAAYAKTFGYWVISVLLTTCGLWFVLIVWGITGENWFDETVEQGALYLVAAVMAASTFALYLSEIGGLLRGLPDAQRWALDACGLLVPIVGGMSFAVTFAIAQDQKPSHPINLEFQGWFSGLLLVVAALYTLGLQIMRTRAAWVPRTPEEERG